jgi:hypothetical protein
VGTVRLRVAWRTRFTSYCRSHNLIVGIDTASPSQLCRRSRTAASPGRVVTVPATLHGGLILRVSRDLRFTNPRMRVASFLGSGVSPVLPRGNLLGATSVRLPPQVVETEQLHRINLHAPRSILLDAARRLNTIHSAELNTACCIHPNTLQKQYNSYMKQYAVYRQYAMC